MKNKIVLITGATSGIGESCAVKFAQEGAKLILNGRNREKLEMIAGHLRTVYGSEVLELPFDVRNKKASEEAMKSLSGGWEGIDILINNAGLVIGVEKEWDVNGDDADTMIETNITGLLTMTRLIVPGMIGRKKGHIINIGSIAGEYAYPGGSVYCATKAAVKMLTDGLRIDLVDTPLRVTNVRPGMVKTNFSVIRYRGDENKADDVYKGLQPLSGEDVAETVYFAASAPDHVQIAEVLVLPTHQATAGIVSREN